MPEITADDKIAFLRQHFPKQSYTFSELASIFGRSKRTVRYWVQTYAVPTTKMTGSPAISQDDLIAMLLKRDAKTSNADKLCGLEFVIEAQKSWQNAAKRGKK